MARLHTLYMEVEGEWIAVAEFDGKLVPFRDIVPKLQVGEAHICRCSACDQQLAKQLAPNPAHFTVEHDHSLSVFRLDSVWVGNEVVGTTEVNISTTCFQVVAGAAGRAWRWSEPPHRCQNCGEGPCAYIELAHFVVRL